MRQITLRTTPGALMGFSKLPMRQITLWSSFSSKSAFSKLPMRQITVLLYSITRTTAVLTPILPNLPQIF